MALMITKLTAFFLLTLACGTAFAQTDSYPAFWIDINLQYPFPAFNYSNDQLKTGTFEKRIHYDGQPLTIQGSFNNFKADGLWSAIDSAGIPRLLTLFRSDTMVFNHLNDSIGRPAHHFTYQNNKLVNEEWYDHGRLDQYNDYSSTGCIITSYHKNMKPRLTFFLNEKGVPYKKIVYDDQGVFVKETTNMNE